MNIMPINIKIPPKTHPPINPHKFTYFTTIIGLNN